MEAFDGKDTNFSSLVKGGATLLKPTEPPLHYRWNAESRTRRPAFAKRTSLLQRWPPGLGMEAVYPPSKAGIIADSPARFRRAAPKKKCILRP